jgi:ATP-dependent RNA helicase RhlE
MSYSYRSSSASPYARPRSGGNNRSGGRKPAHAGQYINPARFISSATAVKAGAEEYIPRQMFADFAVDPLIHTNLERKGFAAPTPIQDETIPLGLSGKDVIGIANTGTGKTAAFAVPLINKLIQDPQSKALIIAPTRELAQQIDEECRTIGKGSGFTGALLIGGANIGPQLRDLRNRPRIVIGTPGRIKDHMERGTLDLSTFDQVVLDEVDRMLDMGFVNDVRSILNELAPARQSFFFSATLDARVRTLIETFANDPVTVSLKTGETSDHVHQDVVHYESNQDKLEKLHQLLISGEISKAIVFDETQRSVERLGNELIERGFKADAIHGGKSQGQRQRALKRFKANEVNILVATDVAARGIDVADISHVINFSVPQTYDSYVHRIGRAGRAGRTGYALTFVAR